NSRRSRFRRLPHRLSAVSKGRVQSRDRVRRGELFSRRGQRRSVRAVGARPRHRHRPAERRGISFLQGILARAAGAQRARNDPVRAPRQPEPERRLRVHRRAGRAHGGRRARALVFSQAGQRARRGAVDQHVLLRRGKAAPGAGLAPRSARFGRPADAFRRRRMGVAAARQSGKAAPQLLRVRQSARLLLAPAAPRFPRLSGSRNPPRAAAQRLGGAGESVGQGRGQAGGNSQPERNQRQHGGLLAAAQPAARRPAARSRLSNLLRQRRAHRSGAGARDGDPHRRRRQGRLEKNRRRFRRRQNQSAARVGAGESGDRARLQRPAGAAKRRAQRRHRRLAPGVSSQAGQRQAARNPRLPAKRQEYSERDLELSTGIMNQPAKRLSSQPAKPRLRSMPPIHRVSMRPSALERRPLAWLRRGSARDSRKNSGPRRPWQRLARRRRITLAVLVLLQTAIASGSLARTFPAPEITYLQIAVVAAFAVLFLWISFSFWTNIAGFFLLWRQVKIQRGAAPDPGGPLRSRTAVVMPICNEDAARVFAGLAATFTSLERTGYGASFDFFVLSDSADPARQAEEEAAWARTCRALGAEGRQ